MSVSSFYHSQNTPLPSINHALLAMPSSAKCSSTNLTASCSRFDVMKCGRWSFSIDPLLIQCRLEWKYFTPVCRIMLFPCTVTMYNSNHRLITYMFYRSQSKLHKYWVTWHIVTPRKPMSSEASRVIHWFARGDSFPCYPLVQSIISI